MSPNPLAGESVLPKWYKRPVNGVPVEQESDAINALRTEYEGKTDRPGGWLSTLVWNKRNEYLSWPEGKTDNTSVRMIVEGFLAEIERIKTEGK